MRYYQTLLLKLTLLELCAICASMALDASSDATLYFSLSALFETIFVGTFFGGAKKVMLQSVRVN